MFPADVGKLQKFRCKWAKQYNDSIETLLQPPFPSHLDTLFSLFFFLCSMFRSLFLCIYLPLFFFHCELRSLATNLLFIWCNGSITTKHFFFHIQNRVNLQILLPFFLPATAELWLLFLLNLFEWKTFKHNNALSQRIASAYDIFVSELLF